MKKILLGSASPRRSELLSQLGVEFQLVKIECDEDFSLTMDAAQVPVYLSQKKSNAYQNLQENELLITADTVVRVDDHILNKPVDAEEAFSMLKQMSGRKHQVTTGVTIRTAEHTDSFGVTTEVSINDLTDEDIHHYISTYSPYDKAGAYGIQEWFGLACVSGISGCFYNVVGLPVSELYKRLKNDYEVL